MAVQQPAAVDARTGDIVVHGREGLSLAVQFKLADGAARDVTAASLFFEVDSVLRVALAAGTSSDRRTISLTRAQVASLAGGSRLFALIDETGTIPDVIWRGQIRVEGYTAQPA